MFLSLLWAATTNPAHALGVGSSIGIGGSPGLFYPSLDLHFDPLLLQIHVLEFLGAIDNDVILIGANLYGNVHETKFSGPWTGVVQAGGGLDLLLDPTILTLTGELRLGAQTQSKEGAGGFGVYVVPAIGVIVGDGIEDNLIAGGALQVSAWFGN